MAFPMKLKGLTTREAIADCVYRSCRAFDENDYELLKGSLTSDVDFVIGDSVIKGVENVRDQSLSHVGKLDTTHFVTNIQIDIESDDATTAKVLANCLAQHYQAGKGMGDGTMVGNGRRYLAGVRYIMDVVKDEEDGLWRASKWVLNLVWGEGDWAVMVPS